MEKIWNGKVYESYKIILDLIKGKGYMDSNHFKGEYLNWKNGMEKEKNIIKAI